MEKILFSLFFIFLTSITYSQVKEAEAIIQKGTKADTIGWKKGGLINVNLAQTSLTNWAAGGQNSVSIQGFLSMFASYKDKSSVWDNNLDIGYGLLQQGESKRFIKTDDKFEITSKYGIQVRNNFFVAGALNFKTQMTVGWNYSKDTQKISNLLSPAYLITALGIDWKPNTTLSLFAAPFTGRITYVNDQELANKGAFGVKPAVYDTLGTLVKQGEKFKKEFGGFLRFFFNKKDFEIELLKNIMVTSKIELFSDFLNKPQNIDVNWENVILFKVNKIISINLTTQLIYDDNVKIPMDTDGDGKFDTYGPRTQFKEIFGLGISIGF